MEVRPSHPFPSRRERRHLNGHRRNSPSLKMADVSPLFSRSSQIHAIAPCIIRKTVFPLVRLVNLATGTARAFILADTRDGEGKASPRPSPPPPALVYIVSSSFIAQPLPLNVIVLREGRRGKGGRGTRQDIRQNLCGKSISLV